MKFGLYLEQNLNPDWKDKYVVRGCETLARACCRRSGTTSPLCACRHQGTSSANAPNTTSHQLHRWLALIVGVDLHSVRQFVAATDDTAAATVVCEGMWSTSG